MRSKTYNEIKTLLEESPELRDSDALLQWEFWKRQGAIKTSTIGNEFLTKTDYVGKAKSSETIRRTRQKIQEKFTHLRSSNKVQELKDDKRGDKGMFVFHDYINIP
jgi:hypothetical protein